jgi:hypothetical protein
MINEQEAPSAAESPFDRDLKEYTLAVETQMHFNEILMKFRSFGIAVVIAVYSYAITRQELGLSFLFGLSPAQMLSIAGVVLTLVLALIDIGYFYRLLLGAVERSTELEKNVSFRLTSTISKHVSERRSRSFIMMFYGVIALWGVVLTCLVLPQRTLQQQQLSITGPIEIKIGSANIQLSKTKDTVAPQPSKRSHEINK